MSVQVPSNSDNPALEERELSKDDILDILSDETNEGEGEEEGKKTKGEEEEEEEGKETKEGEEEEGEEEKEALKLRGEEREEGYKEVPRRQTILKAYPDIFKKFPGIESALYREEQFHKVFSTPKEAEEAAEAADNYYEFEDSILSGNLDKVLASTKRADEKAYNKIIENFVGNLHRTDQAAHNIIATQMVKAACVAMWLKGEEAKNDNAKLAAEIMHEFYFGSRKITPYKRNEALVDKPETEDEKQFRQERESFARDRLDNAVDDVTNRVKRVTRNTINRYLDPKGLMSGYVRKNAAMDIEQRVDEAIRDDDRFRDILDRHWGNAIDSNYSGMSQRRIRNALLSKIQTVLPGILQRVKAEALKGRAYIEEDRPRKTVQRNVGNITPDRKTNTGGKGTNSKDGRGMSTYDFLSS